MYHTPKEGSHGDDDSAAGSTPMSHARIEMSSAVPRVPPQVIRHLMEQVPAFAERVTTRVQGEIPSYAGPADGRRGRLIAMAVAESAALFLRRLDGRQASVAGVDDLFRRMGYGEGHDDHALEAFDQALRIAHREAWRGLQHVVIAAGLPASVLGRMGDELTAFLDHLVDQARTGHAMASRVRERDVDGNRRALLQGLLHQAPGSETARWADRAGWPLPASIVVVAATAPGPVEWPESDDLDGRALGSVEGSRAVFLAPADYADELVHQLQAVDPDVVLARSWPVALDDSSHAHRWATRTLELAESGAIPRQPVIDCARYRTQLWLHAEPALRRQMAQDLLKPLFAETPNSREILSATLLVWLETRESAPAIAAILGVHPQTVRYRWRRINELFGEALHDPEFVVQLTMVLKASVPLWIAGDQSDFERYWSEEAS
jgi:hypothetical protein